MQMEFCRVDGQLCLPPEEQVDVETELSAALGQTVMGFTVHQLPRPHSMEDYFKWTPDPKRVNSIIAFIKMASGKTVEWRFDWSADDKQNHTPHRNDSTKGISNETINLLGDLARAGLGEDPNLTIRKVERKEYEAEVLALRQAVVLDSPAETSQADVPAAHAA
ncbi:hypothetical protein CSA80_04990 [Candidatus Saccharibacteria bacterium]|nr:MAG: hypothetical protein CSA80_04990 [Candidatus Saccharibacteria bacterium]